MFNKVILEGRLVDDVQLKTIPNSDSMVADGTLASNDHRRDKADFIRVKFWNKQAEYVANNTKKGTLILISGRIRTSTYEKDGQKRTFTYVNVDEIRNLERDKSIFDTSIDQETVNEFIQAVEGDGENIFDVAEEAI